MPCQSVAEFDEFSVGQGLTSSFHLELYKRLIKSGSLEQIGKYVIAAQLPKCIEDPKNGYSMLHFALAENQNEIVEYFLRNGYEEANRLKKKDYLLVDNNDNTAAHVACLAGNYKGLKIYADRFPQSMHKRNRDGATPLMLAAQSGCTQAVSYLINEGRVQKDARDNRGRTVCHYAASYGQAQAIYTLFHHCCDWSAKDNDGWTPLDVAYDLRTTKRIVNLLDSLESSGNLLQQRKSSLNSTLSALDAPKMTKVHAHPHRNAFVPNMIASKAGQGMQIASAGTTESRDNRGHNRRNGALILKSRENPTWAAPQYLPSPDRNPDEQKKGESLRQAILLSSSSLPSSLLSSGDSAFTCFEQEKKKLDLRILF